MNTSATAAREKVAREVARDAVGVFLTSLFDQLDELPELVTDTFLELGNQVSRGDWVEEDPLISASVTVIASRIFAALDDDVELLRRESLRLAEVGSSHLEKALEVHLRGDTDAG